VKEELAGLHLTQESLKDAREGVGRTNAVGDFAIAFRRQFDRCEKCIRIGSKRLFQERLKNKNLPSCNRCSFIQKFKFDFDSTLYMHEGSPDNYERPERKRLF
jgi:hypothetical protein